MKKILSFVLSIALLSSISFHAAAAPDYDDYQVYADVLHAYGLFAGTGVKQDGTPEFDLYRAPTRIEALVMLIRLLGAEDAAKSGSYSHPFQDVPAWGEPYVGYAYTMGYTQGIGASQFGTSMPSSEQQYITFLLRALGYEGLFSYENAFQFSDNISLTNGKYLLNGTEFLRGDMVWLSFQALITDVNGGEMSLAGMLLEQNVMTEEQWMKGNEILMPADDAPLSEWVTADDMSIKFGTVQKSNGTSVYCLYELTEDGYARIVHEVSDYEPIRLLNRIEDINGIRMMIEEGVLYFYIDDILALGIQPEGGNSAYDKTIQLYSLDTEIKRSQLYTEPADHVGDGYLRLRGYPKDDVFVTYFRELSSKYQALTVSVEDTRPNRNVTWTYNGKAYVSTKEDCYGFFASTLSLQSYLQTYDGSRPLFSPEWFQATFGSVYTEYLEYLSFTSDAEHMVKAYLDF